MYNCFLTNHNDEESIYKISKEKENNKHILSSASDL